MDKETIILHKRIPMPYIDKLRTLREAAGLTLTEVAKAARISRTTLTHMEKHYAARGDICTRVILALNDLHYTQRQRELDPATLVSQHSSVGSSGLEAETKAKIDARVAPTT